MKARNRTIGPEHLHDVTTYELERESGLPIRWAFAVLKCVADREGRFAWNPPAIKKAVMPHDPVDFAHILSWLERDGLVVQYEFGGRTYGFIPGFGEDQGVNPRETASILPPPSSQDVERWRSGMVGTLFAEGHGASNGKLPDASTAILTQSDASTTLDTHNRISGRVEMDSGGSLKTGPPPSQSEIRDLGDGPKMLDASATESKAVGLSENGARARAGFVGSIVPTLETSLGEKELELQEQSPEKNFASLNSSPYPLRNLLPAPQSAQRFLTTGVEPSGSQQALPAIRGKRTLEAMRERMAQVATEIATGVRRRLYKDQRRKLGAEIVFGYWIELFSHPRAWLDEKREGTIVRRLQENGDDVGELLYALDGARKDTPRNKDTGEVYDGIPTLFRDRAQVERFAERMPAYRKGEPHPVMAQYAELFREFSDVERQELAGQQTLLPSDT